MSHKLRLLLRISFKPLVIMAIIIAAVWIVFGADEEARIYHAVPLEKLARGTSWTHVETDGFVGLVRMEPDGDLHVKLCDTLPRCERFVVAECIPQLPCVKPRKGDFVRVRGIYRKDGRHKWSEVHPIEVLEVLDRER